MELFLLKRGAMRSHLNSKLMKVMIDISVKSATY